MSITKRDFEAFKIPVPESKNEQRRIVARLEALFEEVSEMRRLNTEVQKDTSQIMDSVLSEIFAPNEVNRWGNENSLGELAHITASLVDPTLPENRNLPHIYGASIEEGTGRLIGYNTAEEDGMTSGKYLFEPEAVLYSKIRPYLRKVTIAKFKGLCSADMYPIHPKGSEITPEFLMWTLLSPSFTNYANKLSGRARIPKLNREQLFSFKMRYPSREVQKKIAFRLKAIRAEVDEMKRLSSNDDNLLGQLEQAILTQAFRGEL